MERSTLYEVIFTNIINNIMIHLNLAICLLTTSDTISIVVRNKIPSKSNQFVYSKFTDFYILSMCMSFIVLNHVTCWFIYSPFAVSLLIGSYNSISFNLLFLPFNRNEGRVDDRLSGTWPNLIHEKYFWSFPNSAADDIVSGR